MENNESPPPKETPSNVLNPTQIELQNESNPNSTKQQCSPNKTNIPNLNQPQSHKPTNLFLPQKKNLTEIYRSCHKEKIELQKKANLSDLQLSSQHNIRANLSALDLNNDTNKVVDIKEHQSSKVIPQFITNDNKTNNNNVISEKKTLNETHHTEEYTIKEKTNFDEIYEIYLTPCKHTKSLTIAFIFGAIISFIVLGLSISLLIYTSPILCSIYIFASTVSIITFILGIFIIKKNKALIEHVVALRDDPEKITQSRQRMLLYIFIYFLTALAMFFLVASVCVFSFQTNIKMEIRALGYNKKQWNETYSNYSYKNIIIKITVLMNCLASFSIILSIYCFILHGLILYFVKSYRTFKIIAQFNCLLFFQISFIFVYYGMVCVRFRNVSNIESATPNWVAGGLLGLGIVGIFLGLYGFVAFLLERKTLIWIFFSINVAMFVISLIMNIYTIKLTSHFKGYTTAECNVLYKYVDESFLVDEMQCDSKYLFVSDELKDIQCPKHRIVLDWEDTESFTDAVSGNKVNYGCINQECCLKIYSHVKTSYNYASVISDVLMIYNGYLALICIYFILNVDKNFDEGIKDKFVYLVLFIVSVLIVIVVIVFIALAKGSPKKSKLESFKLNEITEELIVINSNEIMPVNKTTLEIMNQNAFEELLDKIRNDKQYSVSKGNKSKSKGNGNEFKIEMLCKNCYVKGKGLFGKDVIIEEKDNDDNGNDIVFRNISINNENVEIVEHIWDYIEIEPYFYLLPINIHIDILVVNTIDDDNNNSIIIDYEEQSDVMEDCIISEDIDLSIVNLTLATFVDGSVIAQTNNNNSILITISQEESETKGPLYSTILTTTSTKQSTSSFSNNFPFQIGPLYPLISNQPINYNITICEYNTDKNTCQNNSLFTDNFRIGGFAFFPTIKPFYNISLPSNETLKTNIQIIGKVIDSSNNKGLDKVKVFIYPGFITLTTQELTQLSSNSHGDDLEEKPLKSPMTNDNGEYSFTLQAHGQYTAYYSKNNYYVERLVFTTLERTELNEEEEDQHLQNVVMTQTVTQDQIGFVVQWEGKGDVDLHAKFRTKNNYFCRVFFGNSWCMGVNYYKDSYDVYKHGVEKIVIKEPGKYIYMIYLHQYLDISRGYAHGEEKIKGVDYDMETYYEALNESEQLFNKENETNSIINTISNIGITIYSPGYRIPIQTIYADKAFNNNSENKFWIALCINGIQGLNSLKIVDKYTNEEPNMSICDNLYNTNNE